MDYDGLKNQTSFTEYLRKEGFTLYSKAYAKINLGLNVLEKRKDGYYNIQTIMQSINFFDEIELFKTSGGIEFTSNLPPLDEKNICFKAAKLFLKRANPCAGLKIKLTKKIWIGAGLGGGSACAAQLLNGSNKLFGYPLGQNQIFNLARKLGSDVPFFLERGAAFVKGKGELIERLPNLTKDLWLVLIYPSIFISTKWAYANLNVRTKKDASEGSHLPGKEFFLQSDIKGIAKTLHNDFEELVFKKYPVIKKIKEKLLIMGVLGASLSGSGSCVYGILSREPGYCLQKFKKAFPDFEVRIAKAISLRQ